MIDLTNYSHQRGIVILRSQEYRKLVRDVSEISVKHKCIEDYAEMIKRSISRKDKYNDKEMVFESIDHQAGAIQDWASEVIDHVHEICEILG